MSRKKNKKRKGPEFMLEMPSGVRDNLVMFMDTINSQIKQVQGAFDGAHLRPMVNQLEGLKQVQPGRSDLEYDEMESQLNRAQAELKAARAEIESLETAKAEQKALIESLTLDDIEPQLPEGAVLVDTPPNGTGPVEEAG